ncbi:unnamed protein product [Lactuca saligna]|uniref:DNA polymerase delta catalytic subunit n=1 Tax=Lactuca saligna TaxID=75948 RepID=A0AA36EFH6_LACSI|nr:unnamed protein product [Lactuca saligna]
MLSTRELQRERKTSPAAFTRARVDVAVKYSIVERPEKIDAVLYPEISSFLMLIKDQDPYGTRESKEVTLERRVQLDLLQAMQRVYKLSSYSLNSVSPHFFNEQIRFFSRQHRLEEEAKGKVLGGE